MPRNRKGFTLIELLIVVVIIGILAAIAIPKFANTKEKAYIASMKSDLRNLVTAEESYFADNVKARRLGPDGIYKPVISKGPKVRAQERLYAEAVSAARAMLPPKPLMSPSWSCAWRWLWAARHSAP